MQTVGYAGQRGRAHHGRAQGRHLALGTLRVRAVQVVAHCQLDDRITQELQSLVRCGDGRVLVQNRTMGQGHLQEVAVQLGHGEGASEPRDVFTHQSPDYNEA